MPARRVTLDVTYYHAQTPSGIQAISHAIAGENHFAAWREVNQMYDAVRKDRS